MCGVRCAKDVEGRGTYLEDIRKRAVLVDWWRDGCAAAGRGDGGCPGHDAASSQRCDLDLLAERRAQMIIQINLSCLIVCL